MFRLEIKVFAETREKSSENLPTENLLRKSEGDIGIKENGKQFKNMTHISELNDRLNALLRDNNHLQIGTDILIHMHMTEKGGIKEEMEWVIREAESELKQAERDMEELNRKYEWELRSQKNEESVPKHGGSLGKSRGNLQYELVLKKIENEILQGEIFKLRQLNWMLNINIEEISSQVVDSGSDDTIVLYSPNESGDWGSIQKNKHID